MRPFYYFIENLRNQFGVHKGAAPSHLRVPKSPIGGRPYRSSRSLVPVYKRFRSNRTLLNFSNFDLSRSCRNLIPPYLQRRRSPAAWLQYTSLIIRTECGCGPLFGVPSLPIMTWRLKPLPLPPHDATPVTRDKILDNWNQYLFCCPLKIIQHFTKWFDQE